MDTNKLAAETRRVWEFLSEPPELAGFTLIGGSALALHIGHRISEDLDFVTLTTKLPREPLDSLMKRMKESGFTVVRDDDPKAYDEFVIGGGSLHDYQQNLLIDGVKVNLFVPDPDLAGMIGHSTEPNARVASLAELFRTKALAAANRNLSRDWVDLYILFHDHGFTVADFAEAFRQSGIHDPAARIDCAFNNLCRGIAPAGDPGYEMLMPNAPSLPELTKFFKAMRDNYQTAETKRAFGRDNRQHDA